MTSRQKSFQMSFISAERDRTCDEYRDEISFKLVTLANVVICCCIGLLVLMRGCNRLQVK